MILSNVCDRRLPIALAVILALSASAVRAEDPPKRFAGEIEGAQRAAQEASSAPADAERDFQDLVEFAAGDFRMMTTWCERQARKWDDVASAFDKGNEAEARALSSDVQKTHNLRGRWWHRLSQRRHQQQLAPNEEWLANLQRNVPPGTEKNLEQFKTLRKAAADAWGKAADAITPETAEADFQPLIDAAEDATCEAEIAGEQFGWVVWQNGLLGKRSLTAALDKKVTDIEKKREELDQLRRDRVALERRVRVLERERDKMIQDANTEADRAVRAKEEEEAKKRQAGGQ